MSENGGYEWLFAEKEVSASGGGSRFDSRRMTSDERGAVVELGREFTKEVGGVWLLISGRFTSGNGVDGTETKVKKLLLAAFGYPEPGDPGRTLNVLLDSRGGNLDSAYSTVLYLSAYAEKLNVHVPYRAKSASTLLAVGADKVYMSPFGELGPLDTQIPDPRNPANTVSALDCYQSVDYVRDFGFKTVTAVLPELVISTDRRISVNELLGTASAFALGSIDPVLRSVTALDFGGWGRTLRIGEYYARKLLQARAKDGDYARVERIAGELVYGYPHHLFPIDYHEAGRLGLPVAQMDKKVYDGAIKVVTACHRKDFVGFLSAEQADAVTASEAAEQGSTARPDDAVDGHRREERVSAEADERQGWRVRDNGVGDGG